MLEEWYCRSIANNNADADDDDEDSPEEEVPNYKDQYRNLKRKLKFLIYVRCTLVSLFVPFPMFLFPTKYSIRFRKMNAFKKL